MYRYALGVLVTTLRYMQTADNSVLFCFRQLNIRFFVWGNGKYDAELDGLLLKPCSIVAVVGKCGRKFDGFTFLE